MDFLGTQVPADIVVDFHALLPLLGLLCQSNECRQTVGF